MMTVEPINEEIFKMDASSFVYTRPVPIPKKREIIVGYRFIFRLLQIIISLIVGLNVFWIVFVNEKILGSYMMTVCKTIWTNTIFDLCYAASFMVIYLFPSKFHNLPYRYNKLSTSEICFDLSFAFLWGASITCFVTELVYEGDFLNIKIENKVIIDIVLGYVVFLIHLIIAIIGVLISLKETGGDSPESKLLDRRRRQIWETKT